MRKCLGILILTVCVMLSGCRATEDEEQAKELKFAYISKDLDHYWFQQVAWGMERKCEEKGIVFESFNADYDNNRCMELVEQVIDEEFDGLMICVTDQYLGRRIGELCGEAEIPVIAVDDSIQDANGNSFPYVGMATREVGAIGGTALVNLAKEKGFPEDGRIRIIEMDVPELSVFRERLSGYEDALFSGLAVSEEDVLIINSTTGMYEENCDAVRQYFQEHPPGTDEYWIVCGANDDCALAPMHVLQEFGVPAEQILACGLGGYELSIQEFEKGNSNYITVMTQPDVEGAQAVEMMYEYLVNGTDMDTSIILGGAVATCDNYLIYFDSGRAAE